MTLRCPPGLGCPDDGPPATGDSAMTEALTWLAEAGVFAQAVQGGEMVPDFTLADCREGTVDLQQLLDCGPLVLLFVASLATDDARWALQTLQDSAAAINAAGAHSAVISTAAPGDCCTVANELRLSLPFGCDDGGHVARLFGLTYEPPEPSDQWCRRIGLPPAAAHPGQPFILPATYVIRADGIAEYAVLEADLRHRVRVADLLRVLNSLNRRC